MSENSGTNSRLYDHPFSAAYWRDAAAEMKSVKTLVLAALLIALRVVFKQFRIPVGPYLDINTAFVVNALGAMTFGPVVAIFAAMITDTLGAVLFPNGPYFFPFILVEIAGSVIFSLFFYRARITVRRIVLARFSVVFFVNLVLQTPIMRLYYSMILNKSYAWIDLPRILKNITLFPFEALVLVIVFRALMPPLETAHLIKSRSDSLRMSGKTVAALAALTLGATAVFAGGSVYLHNHVSLTSSYDEQQRTEANQNCLEIVRAQDPELEGQEIAAVAESAFRPFLSGTTTWTVAVYDVDAEELARKPEDFKGFGAYSKSKAAKDPALKRRYTAVIVQGGNGKVTSFEKTADGQ